MSGAASLTKSSAGLRQTNKRPGLETAKWVRDSDRKCSSLTSSWERSVRGHWKSPLGSRIIPWANICQKLHVKRITSFLYRLIFSGLLNWITMANEYQESILDCSHWLLTFLENPKDWLLVFIYSLSL